MRRTLADSLAAIPDDPIGALEANHRGGDEADRVDVVFRVPAATRRALKRLAAESDASMQALLEEAIADLFIKYRVPRKA